MVKFLTPEHKAKLHAGLRAYYLKRKATLNVSKKRTLTAEHKAKLHAGLKEYHLKKKVITCSYVKRTLSDEHKAKLHAGLAAYNMKRKLMKEDRNKNYKLAEILLDFKNKIIQM